MDSLSLARSMRGSIGMLAMHWLMAPELAERVVAAASPLGAPTFVGWRDQPLPDPGAGRTMQLCQTMAANGLHAVDFETLSDDERAEFRELAKAARDHAGAKMASIAAVAESKD